MLVEISLLPLSQADVFLATKPSNTFLKAIEKVLEGFVKNGGKPPKIKINRKIFGKTEIFSYLCTKIENMRVISGTHEEYDRIKDIKNI